MYRTENVDECAYFSDGEFDLDFLDDISFQSNEAFKSASSGDVSSEQSIVARSALPRKRGSKFMRKAAASYPPKLALRPKVTKTGVRTLLPNMSRRTRDTMLYAFPSFDRCDSLLFFPSTLARYINAGDIPSMSKLFERHFDKHCIITPFQGRSPPRAGLAAQCMAQKMQLMEEMQPDRITCFRSTQVDGNLIKAVLYMKYLNVPSITAAVERRVKEKDFDWTPCFTDTWQKHLRRKVEQENHSPVDKAHYLSLIDSGCEILVYSRMDMILTIDDHTKRVTCFSVTVTTTSMEEVVRAEDNLSSLDNGV